MVGTGQLSSFQDCQGWGQPVSIVGGVRYWMDFFRHRSPSFRRPGWYDLPVSGAMIDGVRATLSYSYPVPQQRVWQKNIRPKALLLMKRRPAFDPIRDGSGPMALLETLARCRVISAIGT